MKQPLTKAAVIGAGVMGAKIAAHIANAGITVYLLDIVPEGTHDRNAIARTAIDRMTAPTSFPAFTHPDHVKRVIPGNVEDHLGLLDDADWIVEAIVERLDTKQALYKEIDKVRKPDCIISSNTSTIPARELTRSMPARFANHFLITHFFNPPRYMRLVELVTGPTTRSDVVRSIADFIDRSLGKSIVECNDTPGFICNRIGAFWLQCALHEAIRSNLSIEDVDRAFGKPLGHPKTGVFGLFDLIGLDLMPRIVDSLNKGLPASDRFHAYGETPEIFQCLLERGSLGRKSGAGFYRIRTVNGGKISESVDLASGEYRPTREAVLELPDRSGISGLRALLELRSDIGQFAWQVVSEALNYSAGLVPEIAPNLADVDRAMRLGFNWESGPFEMIDRIGAEYLVNRMRREGKTPTGLLNLDGPMYRTEGGFLKLKKPNGAYCPVPHLPGVLSLGEIKRQHKPLLENASASLWDIGDDVLCFEFHTPMNAIDRELLDFLQRTIDWINGKFKALVIYNEARHFSAGANLKSLLAHIASRNWTAIEALIRTGQSVFQSLKYAAFPVIGAPSGLALGGGSEILLHCSAIQAHIELQMGLVETGVGLIPGWGGCKEMLLRNYAAETSVPQHVNAVVRTFSLIAKRRVSDSALTARELNFLRSTDSITMNRDRLLANAKSKALNLAGSDRNPETATREIELPAIEDWLPAAMDDIGAGTPVSEYQRFILEQLANVFSAGPDKRRVDEKTLLERELDMFRILVREPKTLERIQFMLKNRKPLDN